MLFSLGMQSLAHLCSAHGNIVASVQQGRIIVMTLLQTWISLSATRSYLFTEFQDEHAKPMEEDTTLLHSIVLMYANSWTIAYTTLLHFFLDTTLLFWQDDMILYAVLSRLAHGCYFQSPSSSNNNNNNKDL